ncbi:MAG: protein-glutamate O-methyltransferase CheR [Candidatus Marinimicrobia bacterium]|nr:protein-glutamate O-methyltransferase CheR [Candidatus Neomarinimicrobiota bacterium]
MTKFETPSPFQQEFQVIRKLNPDQFKTIRDMLYRHSGIYFNENKQYLLESRLNRRLNELNQDSIEEYLKYIEQPGNKQIELSFLYNHVTINETYFFRYAKQLNAFSAKIIPALLSKKRATGNNQLRIWSAASSSGEEIYSIAMYLLESMGFSMKQWELDIFGTDISPKMLERAREAIYGCNSFRSPEPEHVRWVDKYFTKINGTQSLDQTIRSMVRFDYLNLNDSAAIRRLRGVDVIFCRNVLIYFDQPTKIRVINNLYEILNPGGYLVLGEAESLHQLSSVFKVEHYPGAFVYKKE